MLEQLALEGTIFRGRFDDKLGLCKVLEAADCSQAGQNGLQLCRLDGPLFDCPLQAIADFFYSSLQRCFIDIEQQDVPTG